MLWFVLHFLNLDCLLYHHSMIDLKNMNRIASPIYCHKMDIIKGSSNFVKYRTTTRGTSRILFKIRPQGSNGYCYCMVPSKGSSTKYSSYLKKLFFLSFSRKSNEYMQIAYRYKKDYLVEIIAIRIKVVCERKARLMAKHFKPITVIAFYKLLKRSKALSNSYVFLMSFKNRSFISPN